MDRPGRITLREFIEHARKYRGAFEHLHLAIGSRLIEVDYQDNEELGRALSFIVGADLDEELSTYVLRSLCRQFGIPEDDFYLDPNPNS